MERLKLPFSGALLGLAARDLKSAFDTPLPVRSRKRCGHTSLLKGRAVGAPLGVFPRAWSEAQY